MNEVPHIIRKQTFDIRFPLQEEASALQNRLSRLFHTRLAAETGKVLDRAVEPATLLKLERLEIDLGTVGYADFEQLLIERFLRALEEAIAGRLSLLKAGVASNSDQYIRNFKTFYIDLLRFFLLNGALPWWATGDMLPVSAGLLEEEPTLIKKLLQEIGHIEQVRRRIAYQFPEESIRRVVAILEPEEAGFIFQYKEDIVRAQNATPVVPAENAPFEKAVWLFIMTYLLDDRGSYFNRKHFVKGILEQMALHFNLRYDAILLLFSSVLARQEPLIRRHPLQRILEELAREADGVTQRPPPLKKTGGDPIMEAAALLKKKIAWIKHYLLQGSLPPGAPPLSAEELTEIFLELIRTLPKNMETLLRSAGKEEKVSARLAASGNGTLLKELVQLLEPAEAPFILDYAEKIQTLQHLRAALPVTASGLRNATWKYLLNILFTREEPAFNRRLFLENHLRLLAVQYRIDYGRLLMFLLRPVAARESSLAFPSFLKNGQDGETGQPAKEDPASQPLALAGLLPGLLEAYREHKQNGAVITGAGDERTAGKRTGSEVQQQAAEIISLREVLHYWLVQGHLPWWGRTYYSREAGSLLEELIENSPEETIRLIKWAGQTPAVRQRFILQFSSGVIQQAFALFPAGGAMTAFIKDLMQLLEQAPALKFRSAATVRHMALLTMWELFRERAYEDFRALHFTRIFFRRLGIWTGIPPAMIVRSLLRAARSGKSLPTAGTFADILQEYLAMEKEQEGSAFELSGEMAGSRDTGAVLIQLFYGLDETGRTAFLEEAAAFIRYFLLHHKAPAHFRGSGVRHPGHFFKPLLLLLYSHRPALLQHLLTAGRHQAAARIHLYDAVYEDPSSEAPAFLQWLAPFRDKDILLYIGERWGDAMPVTRTLLLQRFREADMDAELKKRGITSPQVSRYLHALLHEERMPPLPDPPEEREAAASPGNEPEEPAISGIPLPDDHPLSRIAEELRTSAKEEAAQRDTFFPEEEEEGIYITNAGLVLLHPFLGTYLQRLELMREGAFRNEAAQHRALHLLQYLVTGKEQHPEYELVLNKILCNLAVRQPVPAGIRMTEAERALGDSLLKAVMQQWEKMKNTSVENFRASFLQRKGVLKRTEDGWRLQVEQRGYDVLLQTLPWSTGMVKFPWMNEILYVEWI